MINGVKSMSAHKNAQINSLLLLMVATLLLAACGSSAGRYNNRGNAEFEEGDYTAALDNYREAQNEDPDAAEPYYNSGNSLHKQGNLESAETQLKQANRTAEGELAQHSNYNLGNTFYEGQNFESAIEAYKESLRLNPDDKDAKYNLELALKQQQQQEQQQQQQQGGGGGQPPPPDQEQQGEGDQEQENQGQGEQEQEDQQGGGNEPEQDNQGQGGQQPEQDPGRGLTPQEAEQLLDALGQDSQTLQERLQQGFFAPGMPPTEDW